jgi:hypothetical protein
MTIKKINNRKFVKYPDLSISKLLNNSKLTKKNNFFLKKPVKNDQLRCNFWQHKARTQF